MRAALGRHAVDGQELVFQSNAGLLGRSSRAQRGDAERIAGAVEGHADAAISVALGALGARRGGGGIARIMVEHAGHAVENRLLDRLFRQRRQPRRGLSRRRDQMGDEVAPLAFVALVRHRIKGKVPDVVIEAERVPEAGIAAVADRELVVEPRQPGDAGKGDPTGRYRLDIEFADLAQRAGVKPFGRAARALLASRAGNQRDRGEGKLCPGQDHGRAKACRRRTNRHPLLPCSILAALGRADQQIPSSGARDRSIRWVSAQ